MTETRNDAYAEAFQLIARAEGSPRETENELYRFARALESSDELRTALSDPHIPSARRQQIVEDLLGGRAQPATVALVSMAVGAGRGNDLPKIIDQVIKDSAEAKGAVIAEARTAVPLTEDQQQRLTAAIATSTGGREVVLRTIVDPSVVGGVVTQIGDSVLDGSVRTRLSRLRDAF